MKLFIKDHLSFFWLFVISLIILPLLIESLDGLEHHYPYYILLVTALFLCFMVVRFLRRKKMYQKIESQSAIDLSIHQPISEIEKQYMKQLQHIQSTTAIKEEEIKKVLEDQQLLISHAAHQMKTPISVIQLISQANELNKPEMFLEWHKVKQQSEKINFLLNQLLTFNRTNQLLDDFKIESLDMKQLLQEVINDLKDYFIEHDIYPKVTIQEEKMIYSDRKWIKIAIYQLLSNAIKYADSPSTVEILFDKGFLSISNQGEDIPKSDMNRIFDLFYTGTKGRQQDEATGIGLYIVKTILDTFEHPFTFESKNKRTVCTIDFTHSHTR